MVNELLKEFAEKVKQWSKEEFYTELFPKSDNIDDGSKFIQIIEEKISLVCKNPDSKKKYDIMKNLFQTFGDKDWYNEKIYAYNFDDEYVEMQKLVGGSEKIHNDFQSWRNAKNDDEKMEILCRMYTYQYERMCNMYIKPIAKAISGKSISQCAICLDKIIKYDPNTKLVFQPYVNKIRNSISHNGYYFDKEKNKIIFENDDETIEMDFEELEDGCQLQVINEVCISTAEESLKIPLLKTAQVDMRKIKTYCKILELDYDQLMSYYLPKGYSVFEICWKLEQKLKNI